ncbi:MAG: hypothetical protein IJ054_01840 [Lachnospiraceae bacterium]|nr:hypothetical protein [Lachnospiraceae bacterium]
MNRINYTTNNINLAAKFVAADGASLFFQSAKFMNPCDMQRATLNYAGMKVKEKQNLTDTFVKELEDFLGNVPNSWGIYKAEIFTVGEGVLVDAGIFNLKIIYKKGHFSMFYSEPDGIKISSEPNISEKTGEKDKEKVHKKSNNNSFRWKSA